MSLPQSHFTSGEITIDKSVIIQGPGANVLTVSGSNNSRIVYDPTGSGVDVNISGLTLTGGNGMGSFLGNEAEHPGH